MNKKLNKRTGLTNFVYKQPYKLYLKTIEFKKALDKSKKLKEETKTNDTDETLNTSVPMDCPDKIYLKPVEVSFTF